MTCSHGESVRRSARRYAGILLSATMFTPLALPVAAQSDQAAGNLYMEEIIVTTMRREQRLQEVGGSVSAFTAGAIERMNIESVEEIAMRTPNFTKTEFNIAQPRLFIRGIGSTDDGAAQDNSVAVFLDDIYLSRGAAQAFELFDIERVEVLRGPQGTLYGKNVVGGVMNVITAKPSQEFAAKGELSFGNYDAITAKAMLNGGLTETLSARVSAVVQDRDGYARNIVTGEDLEDRQFFGIRGQLRWQPNENIDVILAADYSDHEDNGLSRKGQGPFGPTPFGTVTAVQTTTDPRESESPRESFQMRELWGVSARLDAEIGIGTLTSLTAYRESDVNLSDAFTGIGSPPFPVLDTANIEIEKAEQFSQEVRLAFQPFDWLNTIAGVYYLNEDVNRTEIADLESVLGTLLPDVLGSLTGTSGSFQLATNESLGFFVNATIDFADQFSAVIGGRYSKDWKDINTGVESLRDVGCCIAAPPTEEFDISAKESWDAFTPSFTLQYAASEDINFYGTVSRGFKSGGFQGQAPTGSAAETPFNPEFAWNYELGAKTDWFDRRLTFNISLFYTEYSDLQVRQNSTRPGETIPILRITNAADAEVKGVEIEWSATPIPELMVWGS